MFPMFSASSVCARCGGELREPGEWWEGIHTVSSVWQLRHSLDLDLASRGLLLPKPQFSHGDNIGDVTSRANMEIKRACSAVLCVAGVVQVTNVNGLCGEGWWLVLA